MGVSEKPSSFCIPSEKELKMDHPGRDCKITVSFFTLFPKKLTAFISNILEKEVKPLLCRKIVIEALENRTDESVPVGKVTIQDATPVQPVHQFGKAYQIVSPDSKLALKLADINPVENL